MSDLRLYDYAASCNCYKVRLLLALLDRPYERVPVDIFDGDTLTEAFGRMNPSRSTPVLQIAADRCLIESNAIVPGPVARSSAREPRTGAMASSR